MLKNRIPATAMVALSLIVIACTATDTAQSDDRIAKVDSSARWTWRTARPQQQKDRAMADIFMGYIATFAKAGDPNRSGLPSWPRYDAAKSELMMFTPDGAAIIQADPWKSRLDLIERAVEARAAPSP
jgi:hypothetical protein